MTKAKTKPKANPEVLLPSQRLAVVRPQPRPQSEAEALLQIIGHASRAKEYDVAKLKELVTLFNEQKERQALSSFAEAMSAAQREMEPVRRDCYNPQTKSKYASYAALDAKIRPIYSKHGFSLTFDTEPTSTHDYSRVVCDLFHTGGYRRRYQKDVPIDTKGPKGADLMTKTHASMSADTYGMRNLLRMMFNIATIDDDGNLAGAGPSISAEQLIELEKLIEQTGTDLDVFCTYLRVAELPTLPASRFDEAKKALRLKAERKKEGRT